MDTINNTTAYNSAIIQAAGTNAMPANNKESSGFGRTFAEALKDAAVKDGISVITEGVRENGRASDFFGGCGDLLQLTNGNELVNTTEGFSDMGDAATLSGLVMASMYTGGMNSMASDMFAAALPVLLLRLSSGDDTLPAGEVCGNEQYCGGLFYGDVTGNFSDDMSGGKYPRLSECFVPTDIGKSVQTMVQGSVAFRSPQLLRAIIDQFGVDVSARYTPGRNGYTYCNVFVADVMEALGVPFPRTGAIAMEKWLETSGSAAGWREVGAAEAQRYANLGKPAVTTNKIGHVQVVCPSMDGEYVPDRGVSVAQAGRIVSNYTYDKNVYSASAMKNVRYFVHE